MPLPNAPMVSATGTSTIDLATGLAPGTHVVALTRQTEGVYGDSQLLGITVGAGALMDPPAAPSRLIEVVGASVSCGYGNLGTSPCGFTFATESHFDTYEAVAARRLAAEVSVVVTQIAAGVGAVAAAAGPCGNRSAAMPKDRRRAP